MILPREIRPLLEKLESIVEMWPVTIRFDRVAEWLLQFDPEDYDIGARIVRHLNVLGPDEIRSGCQSLILGYKGKPLTEKPKSTVVTRYLLLLGTLVRAVQ